MNVNDMLEVIKMMKIIFLLLMGFPWRLVRSQPSLCTTKCPKGNFCIEDDCFLCPSGTFTTNDDHTENYCKKWTSKPVKNSVIIENGTPTSDIIWGCGVGFERKNISNDGSWDCVKVTTTSPPSSSPLPPTTTSTTVTSVGTETTASPSTSQESDSSLLIGLTIGTISLALLLLVLVLFMLWRFKKLQCILKRRTPKRSASITKTEEQLPENQQLINGNQELMPVKNNPELTKLYYTIVDVIGLEDCVKMLGYIYDESGKLNKNIYPLNKTNCVKSFQSWETLNAKENHCERIADALKKLEYRLPLNNDFKDPVLLNICLCEMKQLNDVYKKFLLKLPPLLGQDIYAIIDSLHLRSKHETMQTGRMETDFMTCIAKWSYDHPYNPNETDWRPLSDIKKKLQEMKLKTVEQKFDSLAEEVTCALKNYLDLKRIFYLVIEIIGHENVNEFFKYVKFNEKLVLTSTSQCMDTFENWRKRHPNASHKKDILDFLFMRGCIETKFIGNEDTHKVIDVLSRIVANSLLIKNESTVELEG